MAASPASSPPTAPRPVRWKKVLVPTQHGSWGFVLEPILLGLLVAPSWPGLGLALAALAVFLAHRPFDVLRTELRRGHRDRRTAAAAFAALALTALALAALLAAVRSAGTLPWLPLALASPFAAVFAAYDLRRAARALVAELCAPAAFASVAAAVALAGGEPLGPSLALAGAMAARGVPSVLYIRARLRLERGTPYRRGPVLASHLLALGGVAGAIASGLLPLSGVVGFAVLALRAVLGLSCHRRPSTPQRLGKLEFAYGALTVLALAAGGW